MATRTATKSTRTKKSKTKRPGARIASERALSKPAARAVPAAKKPEIEAPAPRPFLRAGDPVKYTPPWANYDSHEVEYGRVERVEPKMVYVRYFGSAAAVATHPANLSPAAPEMVAGV